MESRLIERDPLTGEEEWLHYDEATDTTFVETRFDAQDVVDLAASQRNHTFGFSKSSVIRPLAEIPNTLVYQWLLKDGFNLFTCSKQELQRKLADYPKLVTAPKRTSANIIISGSR